MSGTNEFIPFATGAAARVMTQADYVALTSRLLGFDTGIAMPQQVNKVWRQATSVSAMIGQFTLDQSGQASLDNGDIVRFENNFRTAVQNAALAAVGTGFLRLTGGTLTGALTIAANQNQLTINAPAGQDAFAVLNGAAGRAKSIWAETGGLHRWTVAFSDNAAETGSNAGSNFNITRYNDAGASLGVPFAISRATGITNFTNVPTVNGVPLAMSSTAAYLLLTGGTLSGPLSINAAGVGTTSAVQFAINAPAGHSAFAAVSGSAGLNHGLLGFTGTALRWSVLIGDSAPETGGNNGSNFDLQRHSDAGAYLDSPISVNRATGVVNFARAPTMASQPMPYVSKLTNDTMAGTLGVGGHGIFYNGVYPGHSVAFGWNGTKLLCSIDGLQIGIIATEAYVGGTGGGFLPLGGGTLTGILYGNGSVNGYAYSTPAGIWAGGTSGFGNLNATGAINAGGQIWSNTALATAGNLSCTGTGWFGALSTGYLRATGNSEIDNIIVDGSITGNANGWLSLINAVTMNNILNVAGRIWTGGNVEVVGGITANASIWAGGLISTPADMACAGNLTAITGIYTNYLRVHTTTEVDNIFVDAGLIGNNNGWLQILNAVGMNNVLNVAGRIWTGGSVESASYVYAQGNVYGGAGGVYLSGNGIRFPGGNIPGGGGDHLWNFRWDNATAYVRVDNAVEFPIAGAGAPTGNMRTVAGNGGSTYTYTVTDFSFDGTTNRLAFRSNPGNYLHIINVSQRALNLDEMADTVERLVARIEQLETRITKEN